MEEGLLFDGVTLRAGDVSPGTVERAASVVAYFADSGLAFGDRAGMAAGVAADPLAAQVFDQCGIGFADFLIEDGAEGGHG